jgi:hypothetical protein
MQLENMAASRERDVLYTQLKFVITKDETIL